MLCFSLIAATTGVTFDIIYHELFVTEIYRTGTYNMENNDNKHEGKCLFVVGVGRGFLQETHKKGNESSTTL
jgi:hypothetical protein